MHPDKGSRSIRTDVLTDSETTYEGYVRVLNSLHRKVSRLVVCVSFSVLCAWGGEDLMNMHVLNFSQPKSDPFCNRCIAHRMYTLMGGGYFNMYILHYFRTIFSFNFVCVLSWLKYSAGLVSFIEHPVIYICMRIRNNIYSMPIDVSISTEYLFS